MHVKFTLILSLILLLLGILLVIFAQTRTAEMTNNEETYYLTAENKPSLFLRHLAPGNTHKPKARPVLYIHGATFPSALSIGFKFDNHSWMDDLSEAGFSVWALDFTGYGESDRYVDSQSPSLRKYIPGRSVEVVEQIQRAVHYILEHEGDESLSLIAHSWGTIAAGLYAGDHPEFIDHLVLFGPIAQRLEPEQDPSTTRERLVTVEQQYKRFVSDVPSGHPPVLLQRHFEKWGEAYLDSDPASRTREPASVAVPNGAVADIRAAWGGNLAYDPSKIKAPTLIVRGEWDSLCDDNDARWLLDALATARSKQDIKIAKATHLMHLEESRFELYKAVRRFLEKT